MNSTGMSYNHIKLHMLIYDDIIFKFIMTKFGKNDLQ